MLGPKLDRFQRRLGTPPDLHLVKASDLVRYQATDETQRWSRARRYWPWGAALAAVTTMGYVAGGAWHALTCGVAFVVGLLVRP